MNNCDFYKVEIPSLLNFLTVCFNKGSSYGTLNSHRSAISLISSNKIGEDIRVKRFFKGIFKLKPTFPRYTVTWNPSIVLDYLEKIPHDSCNLEKLSKKLIMLLALSTGQRMQTLSLIKTSNIKLFNDRIIISITDLIKTSGIGRIQPVLNLPYFNQRPGVCPASVLQKYLLETASIRPDYVDRLIITFKKPHRAATSQTIGRWLKQTLGDSGIDISIFGAHSTRHASTSAASRAGVSIDVIRRSAGWSEQSAVFANFYNRPVVDPATSLLDAIV